MKNGKKVNRKNVNTEEKILLERMVEGKTNERTKGEEERDKDK